MYLRRTKPSRRQARQTRGQPPWVNGHTICDHRGYRSSRGLSRHNFRSSQPHGRAGVPSASRPKRNRSPEPCSARKSSNIPAPGSRSTNSAACSSAPTPRKLRSRRAAPSFILSPRGAAAPRTPAGRKPAAPGAWPGRRFSPRTGRKPPAVPPGPVAVSWPPRIQATFLPWPAPAPPFILAEPHLPVQDQQLLLLRRSPATRHRRVHEPDTGTTAGQSASCSGSPQRRSCPSAPVRIRRRTHQPHRHRR